MIKKTIRNLFRHFISAGTIRRWRAHQQSIKFFQKHYPEKINTLSSDAKNKILIYTADGNTNAGGLADRFRGMVSMYFIAKKIGIDYRIRSISPFPLSQILLPNRYDWTIDEVDVSFNPKHAIYYTQWGGDSSVEGQERDATEAINSFIKKYRQIHYTTNIQIADDLYGELFDELFQPSPHLLQKIAQHSRDISGPYIAATFRFQQLLGDFIEGDFPILIQEKQDQLLNSCLQHLLAIHQENISFKILVTSDSIRFLEEAKKFPFSFVVPGDIRHLDYSLNSDYVFYLKSFIDYFMLTGAEKIYLVVDGPMYSSGFPRRAAIHRKIPFIVKIY